MPLFFVGLGDAHEARDIYLHDLQVEESVYVHDRVVFELKLTAQGYEGITAPVVLKEKGNDELISNHDRYWITTDAMQEGNPVQILQRGERVELPPCLVVHPEKDQWMSVEGAEAFVSSYQRAGGHCELAVFKNMPHGIAGWDEPNIQSAVERMKRFIADSIAVPTTAG